MLFMMLIFAGGIVYIYKFTRLLKTVGSACEPTESEKVAGTASYILDANKMCIPSNCLTGYTFSSNTCVADTVSGDTSNTVVTTSNTVTNTKTTSGTDNVGVCTPSSTQKDTYGVTYKLDKAGVCRAASCKKGYELNTIEGLCKIIQKSKYTGAVCDPKKQIPQGLEYQKTQDGSCQLYACNIGYTTAKDLKKCVINTRDPRIIRDASDCSKNFQINSSEFAFQRGGYAGIKWFWPGTQIDCLDKVAYYIVEVYGNNDPDYKIGIKVVGGKKLSVGFNYMYDKFLEDGAVFSITPYDKKDVKVALEQTIALNPPDDTKSGESLGIDMRDISEWNLHENVIQVKLDHIVGGVNPFGYTIFKGELGNSEILEDRPRDGKQLGADARLTAIPKGGSYAYYCQWPVAGKQDWWGMTWEEVIAGGANKNYKWFHGIKCISGDALKGNESYPL